MQDTEELLDIVISSVTDCHMSACPDLDGQSSRAVVLVLVVVEVLLLLSACSSRALWAVAGR